GRGRAPPGSMRDASRAQELHAQEEPSMRTCVVTGATSGIGRAAAAYFARQGARVIACGRDPEKLEVTVAELRGGGQVEAACFDVADQAAVSRALGAVGPIDVLIAAAGVCLQARLDDEASDEVWRR